ncbi:MAG: hypothetical protein AAF330_07730, partial [Pseudomonadota bacterium]
GGLRGLKGWCSLEMPNLRSGWTAGAGIEYAFQDEGQAVSAQTVTALAPIVAVIFGQAGLRIGATVEGTKFTRIIP